MSPPTTFWSWKRTSSRLMTSYRARSTCFAFTRSRQKVTPAATAPNSSWRRWLSVSARVRANAPVGVCLSYCLLSHTKVRNFDACDRWVGGQQARFVNAFIFLFSKQPSLKLRTVRWSSWEPSLEAESCCWSSWSFCCSTKGERTYLRPHVFPSTHFFILIASLFK